MNFEMCFVAKCVHQALLPARAAPRLRAPQEVPQDSSSAVTASKSMNYTKHVQESHFLEDVG